MSTVIVSTGRANMVHSADNEQGLSFQVHDHNWKPVDFEGITLMLRPAADTENVGEPSEPRRQGWSNASKRRCYRR
ncbi:type I-E CRISPR-associated endoribonuclease Cas2 [Lentzea sp. DG1S-22]|uniref:type I-E CRISPR-associated endoribonuclease Cas2 n=1 Tax=Lentzea sp. DG1S-22 TaxID=3108822 RepID=UPI002E788CB1|nr:type I-E CRISPR-associated endoribonuclease Cas2 [Lentzea sp. DG1S-22]WVH82757.1 type I-E CRISPR-associated endoribonuclease Cas2 [Lentzea sp. DG1S-22]